jgi:hypothetical protein
VSLCVVLARWSPEVSLSVYACLLEASILEHSRLEVAWTLYVSCVLIALSVLFSETLETCFLFLI